MYDYNNVPKIVSVEDHGIPSLSANKADRKPTRFEEVYHMLDGNLLSLIAIVNRLSALSERIEVREDKQKAAENGNSGVSDGKSSRGMLWAYTVAIKEQNDKIEQIRRIISHLETII